LGSRENIAIAKCELLEHLHPTRGVAILGSNSEALVNRAKAVFNGTIHIFEEENIEIVEADPEKTCFKIKGSEQLFEVKAHGMPLISDAWCAVMAGRVLGLTDAEIADGLKFFKTVGGRGNRVHAPNGALIIDESYNANPESVRAAIMALRDGNAFPQKNKFVVLGDLLELGAQGPALLEELGGWLKANPVSLLITVGTLARHIFAGASGAAFEVVHCQDMQIAEEELRRRMDNDTCILIKGSRGARLDKLVGALAAQTA
jgi:UDP-N-acetylmuramoyl-tripeptide--D-alanyl-D-alanine ligase